MVFECKGASCLVNRGLGVRSRHGSFFNASCNDIPHGAGAYAVIAPPQKAHLRGSFISLGVKPDALHFKRTVHNTG